MRLQSSVLIGFIVVVALGSVACTSPEGSDDPQLTGTTWELQQIQLNDGQVFTADPPQNYTAEFTEGGEVFLQADCNRVSGSFTTEEDRLLSVTLGPSTFAACPPGSISDEYQRFMGSANSFFFQDDELIIELKFDSGSMVFSPAN
jgi:heat shock protein HslJ